MVTLKGLRILTQGFIGLGNKTVRSKIQAYSLVLLFVMSFISTGFISVKKDYLINHDFLILTGNVNEISLKREDESSIIFELQLKLEFENVSDHPALLLKQDYWVGTKTLSSSTKNTYNGKYIFSSGGWPSIDNSDKWKQLHQQINQINPPNDLFYLILPKEKVLYTPRITLYIEKKGSFDKLSKPWHTIKQYSPIFLQIRLETWPVNIEPLADPHNLSFGKELATRWKQIGNLQLERIKSEPIEIRFPND